MFALVFVENWQINTYTSGKVSVKIETFRPRRGRRGSFSLTLKEGEEDDEDEEGKEDEEGEDEVEEEDEEDKEEEKEVHICPPTPRGEVSSGILRFDSHGFVVFGSDPDNKEGVRMMRRRRWSNSSSSEEEEKKRRWSSSEDEEMRI